LWTLRAGKFDSAGEIEQKKARKERYEAPGHCRAGGLAFDDGLQTLFVNAAIEGEAEEEQHLPWIVEFELPATKISKKRGREDDEDDLSKRLRSL
jgi:hypothetical protein